MGKVKRQRQKLHTSSSKTDVEDEVGNSIPLPAVPDYNPFDNPFKKLIGVGTLKKLPDDWDAKSSITNKSLRGIHGKKKDKRKLRHDLWLQKLNAGESAKNEEKARKKREKTAIVGDMRPLEETLPTLELLLKGKGRKRTTSTSSDEKAKSLKKEATRKKEALADIRLFQQVLKHPKYKESPFHTISEHLHNKQKQEDEMDS
ncbi:unnamed protein product [Owenia fusiformis]|uniref:Uncharacterized protein n=1 Tax=Owenia fusiformis TaxID=6347 RepID=A0A8J1YBL3_OWEFU|nr:unnamed protein product [Owenia fusiformis]